MVTSMVTLRVAILNLSQQARISRALQNLESMNDLTYFKCTDFLSESFDVSDSFLCPKESRETDDVHFHDDLCRASSCTTSLPPGENFGTLQSAALSATAVQDQSCPEGPETKGIKRRCSDFWEDSPDEADLDITDRNHLGCNAYTNQGDPGFEGDTEDDEDDDGTYFLPRPPKSGTQSRDWECLEPVRKKLRYSSSRLDQSLVSYNDTIYEDGSIADTSYSDTSSESIVIGYNVNDGSFILNDDDSNERFENETTLAAADACTSDSNASSDNIVIANSVDGNSFNIINGENHPMYEEETGDTVESAGDGSRDRDTPSESSDNTSNSDTSSPSDSDSSDSSDSDSDSSDSDDDPSDGHDDTDNTDDDSSDTNDNDEEDDDDDLECLDSCICNGGRRAEIRRIKRKRGMEVLRPLYVKLLDYRLMRRPNRVRYKCCEKSCKDHWHRRPKYEVHIDYDESDLQVDHFSWGTWKEEEPVCPKSCICKTGQLSLNVEEIDRKPGFRVLEPLYKRVLQRRLMRDSNRFGYKCCERRCSLYRWGRDRDDVMRLKKDYHKSDLNVTHYSWGEWKANSSSSCSRSGC